MKKACIVGVTGFGGCGLLEILSRHDEIEVTQICAKSETGFKITEMYPHLDYYDLTVTTVEELNLDEIDIAFFSTPDRAGMRLIHEFNSRNIPVIDFSGDFRFQSIEDYEVYAKNKSIDTEHHAPNLLSKSVFGLCEKNREHIAKASIVGNPGCFAISLMLPLLPLCEKKLITDNTIICDSKSGVSGAGKNPGKANFYPQRYENINTYREGSHQHLVEVENVINSGGSSYSLFFVPQVVPMNRGILSNIYAQPAGNISSDELVSMYDEYYRNEPFVKIVKKSPDLSFVRGTNYCVIRPMVDSRTGSILVTSVIDNLMKGQSGNAVQCANIMLGLNEKTGLDVTPFYP